MTLRAYRDFDPNDPHNQDPNQAYDTGNDAADFQGTFLDSQYAGQFQQEYGRGYGTNTMTHKNKLWMVMGVLGLVAIGFAAAFTISAQSTGEMPIITADTTAYKAKPETPGGIEIPFQDKLVFNRLDPEGQQVQAERLLPPTEEPMTLALQPAQREPSMPAPKEQLATQQNAAAVAKTLPVETTAAPVAAPVAATTTAPQIEAMAPATGAIPAPINEEVAVAETPTPAPAPAAPVAVAKPVEAAKVTPTVAGGTRVQLASLPERGAGETALTKLQNQYGSALGGAKLTLVRADIPGKGTYWRVQSQPMDRADAQKICGSVKAQGGACLLAK